MASCGTGCLQTSLTAQSRASRERCAQKQRVCSGSCVTAQSVAAVAAEHSAQNEQCELHELDDLKRHYVLLGRLALNVALLGVFDAVLIAMLFALEAATQVRWQRIKGELFALLNAKKLARTLQVLREGYADHDVLLLQELRNRVDAAEAELSDFALLATADHVRSSRKKCGMMQVRDAKNPRVSSRYVCAFCFVSKSGGADAVALHAVRCRS